MIYAFAKKASQAAPVGSFRSPDCQRIVFAHAGARARLRDVQRACRYIELSGDRDFNEEYPEQMFFYEEDEEWN